MSESKKSSLNWTLFNIFSLCTDAPIPEGGGTSVHRLQYILCSPNSIFRKKWAFIGKFEQVSAETAFVFEIGTIVISES